MRHPTPFSIGSSLAAAIGFLALLLVIVPAVPAGAGEPDKTLKLFFAHTGERAEFTFKKNGRYDRRELDRINHFLRDWRRDEPTHMDPHLLDLVWAIYKESGSRDYIHVVSAYRSPATNEMLRQRTSGVAKNSQHRLGRAMDWFVTDVPLSKLRAVAMKMQGGGVGYYPRSGSPFIHTDTGSVRAWPRMSREQLIALFPNGNTLHLPADGKPLPGYEQALARRKASGNTALAYLEDDSSDDTAADRSGTESGGTWLSRVFKGDGSGGGETTTTGDATVQLASVDATADPMTDPTMIDPRLPRARPGSGAAFPGEEGSVVAAADSFTLASFARPAHSYRADEIGIRTATEPLAVPRAEDAITAMVAPRGGAEDAAAPPLELAYAAQPTRSDISEADRAILAAFASINRSDALRRADAALVVAATRRAGGSPPPADASGGIVLSASDLPVYGSDEDALLDLLDDGPSDPAQAALAMPEPRDAKGLYSVPEGASAVADLRGDSGPPVNHFAPAATASVNDDRGFFTKLFASLIE